MLRQKYETLNRANIPPWVLLLPMMTRVWTYLLAKQQMIDELILTWILFKSFISLVYMIHTFYMSIDKPISFIEAMESDDIWK